MMTGVMSRAPVITTVAYLRLLRFPNLLIVAGTQLFLYYALLLPALNTYELEPLLNEVHFALFVLVTILITAGGYLINDLVDYEIDQVNRPDKVIVNRLLSAERVKQFYYSLLLLGLLLSIYLAHYAGQLILVLIYPLAAGLLHLYSTHLKKRVLLGNLLVSLFCAGVAGIIWFAERAVLGELRMMEAARAEKVVSIIAWYMAFAFFSTLYREIIKDMEDVQGDTGGDCRTLPVVYGLNTAKVLAAYAAMLLLAFLVGMVFRVPVLFPPINLGALMILVVLPLLFSCYYLYHAQDKQHFHRLSSLAKWMMVGGLLLLLL